MMLIFAPFIPFFGIFFVAEGVAQGSRHVKVYTGIAIARLWLFRIGLSYLLSLAMGMGVSGIWIAMAISNVFAGIALGLWLASGK